MDVTGALEGEQSDSAIYESDGVTRRRSSEKASLRDGHSSGETDGNESADNLWLSMSIPCLFWKTNG